jgi:5-hydroxyisourate hydrolase
MSGITTHVLDVSKGRPAAGVAVSLEVFLVDGGWVKLIERTTDADGRVKDFVTPGSALDAGRYRLTFDTANYFAAQKVTAFYPMVPVVFEIQDPKQSYHVPLLLSPFGYSTYRGS